MKLEKVNKIIIHCSDSEWGDAEVIDHWHKNRGWDGNGYHHILLNGRRTHGVYEKKLDGVIEPGRPLDKVGAHCKGQNKDSIGICLIGRSHFSSEQLFISLPGLVKSLLNKHNLTINDVYGHYEFNSGKTCPNLDMDAVRRICNG